MINVLHFLKKQYRTYCKEIDECCSNSILIVENLEELCIAGLALHLIKLVKPKYEAYEVLVYLCIVYRLATFSMIHSV